MADIYEIAEEFVLHTNCSLFITGKAGSGKTTLLRRIVDISQKQTVVVAPTGVAAINAGGTTIHSFFQLPLTPFLPTDEHRRHLISKQQVQEVRRNIFRNLDLLIVDEVSMVRADVLDAIDTVLRHYRHRHDEPFGGVQVVFFGDMYQLPPVCTGEEWPVLQQFYPSLYFFCSRAVGELRPVYLELDRIFRQTNRQFINLLNEVRNNTLTADSVGLLNMRYIPDFDPDDDEGYITLTTHNAMADAINDEKLNAIDNPHYTFTAKIEGDFPDRNYPTELDLKLKVGAKVMFIANDKVVPRRYYNGKIGYVADIDDDTVWVSFDDGDTVQVESEVWSNRSYKINKESNLIEEKVLGTFTQLPLRLAWAVTIHKSQGLTFDRVIIDAAAAFASGQVYVALSRCRTLDGIVLTSQISSQSLLVDPAIVQFSSSGAPVNRLEDELLSRKREFELYLIIQLFSLEPLMIVTHDFHSYITGVIEDFNPETSPFIETLKTMVSDLYKVGGSFHSQLLAIANQQDYGRIAERVVAASHYYTEKLTDIVAHAIASPAVTDSRTEADDYVKRLHSVFKEASLALYLVQGVSDGFSAEKFYLLRKEYQEPKFKVKAYVASKGVDKNDLKQVHNIELYKRLYQWRNDYCNEHDIPVYSVLPTATLIEIADTLPLTVKDLGAIKGFGKIKLQKYGGICHDMVREYMEAKGYSVGVQADLFDGESLASVVEETQREKKRQAKQRRKAVVAFEEGETVEKKPQVVEPPRVPTLDQTRELLQKGMGIREIAEQRGLAESTIYNHIGKLIFAGEADVRSYVDEETLTAVMQLLVERPSIPNKELFEHFEQKYSYGILSLIRAYQMTINN